MEHQSNQTLKTFEFLTMTFAVFVIIGVSVPIIKKNLQATNVEKAKQESLALASALTRSDNFDVLRKSTVAAKMPQQGRSIASVSESAWEGQTGLDPWGKPYRFRFLRNAQGTPVEIAVWSNGPENVEHSPEVSMSSVDGVERLRFNENDVVVSITPLR